MFDCVNIYGVRQVLNFVGKNSSFNGDNSIPDLQTKGVTALCKILQKQQYAYLADEVGMGKTYQAIGVIAMLLKEKPDAKILIIAPNSNVQNNWMSEIKNFQKNNLTTEITLNVKNFIGSHEFLSGFKEEINENIFITRLTTFSTIGDSVVRFGNLKGSCSEQIPIKKLYNGLREVTGMDECTNYRMNLNSFDAGKICGKFLRKYTTNFDLVIIDEAQNLRNENNATVFLNYWLGLKRCKEKNIIDVLNSISTKKMGETRFLLLSATPAHRSIKSLRDQLLYFESEKDVPKEKDINHDFLERFMIRRLRTYNGKSKYDVRNIVPNNVAERLEKDDENGIKQRLFLALIQSKLAKIKAKNNAVYKIGFLETFESYRPSEEKQNDEETGESGKEFENYGSHEKGEMGEAPDKKILQNISKSFDDVVGNGAYPPHPKFSFMEESVGREIVAENLALNGRGADAPDKVIVFVRRLASVDELEKRLNSLYEDKIISYWGEEFNLSNACLEDVQKEFEIRYNKKTSAKILEDDFDENDIDGMQSEEPEDAESIQSKSRLIKWLALKKHHKGRAYYAVSKFKKSMLKNKPNSVLFAENYFTELYGNDEVNQIVDNEFVIEVNEYIAGDYNRYVLEYGGNKKYNKSEILPLCCFLALKRKGNNEIAKCIKAYYAIGDRKSFSDYCSGKIIKEILLQDSLWNHMVEHGVRLDCEAHNFYKREILKAVAEKYMKSSEAVLDLMYVYMTDDANDLCNSIMNRLFSSKCTHGVRIKKLFDEGELVCKQLLGGDVVESEKQLNAKLGFLNLQQWVMPAVGGNKGNEGLIKRFNTPFYPDIIVCTDVLKEGINLHLFCNRIYHYGLAWTPGDLEQRIGRVDRFFCKTHRERAKQGNLPEEQRTRIEVNYPYLGKSVDEQQLKQVLKFKLSADPLLDSKTASKKDIQIDLDEKTVEELASYKPEKTDICPYSGENFLE